MNQEPIPHGVHEPEEKLEPGALATNSRVLKWLDNFWYHYKWHTIIGLFAAVVIIIGVVQMFSRPKYDTMLACANPYRMSDEEKAAFDQLLSRICPEDFNGDGEKRVNFTSYQVYSDEEMRAEKESLEAESEEFFYNAQFFAKEYENFIFFTQTGEGAVCLVSRYVYENLIGTDPVRLRAISDLYPDGDLPKGVTEDGYGVIFGKTDLYIYHSEAQVLPEDLVLCLLLPTVNADKAGYADSVAFFRAMVEYRVG